MSAVTNPIPHLEVERKLIHDLTAHVSLNPVANVTLADDFSWRASSRKPRGFGFATTSTHIRERHEKVVTGYDVLRDIFTTQCHTGVRVSPFFAGESELRSVLTLHGLDSTAVCVRDLKITLLNHLLSGDCYGSQCLSPNHVSRDRTACVCIAEGFSSSLAITEHICKLLRDSDSSIVTTNSLLIAVQSVKCDGPYENRTQIRRRVLKSLQNFLDACREKSRRSFAATSADPFGDLFTGFESMCKPVLMSIMDRHCILVGERRHMSTENMRSAITSHIADGHCVRSTPQTRMAHLIGPQNVVQNVSPDVDISAIPSCEDFVRYFGMSSNICDIDTRIRSLTYMLEKFARKPLLRLLKDQQIEHSPDANLKGLRSALKKFINRLRKSNRDATFLTRANHRHDESIAAQWPTLIPQALKDLLINNFREETSSDHLATYVCASCSESDFVFNRTEISRSELDLSVLQSSPGHQLAIDSMAHLDVALKSQGILVDARGITASSNSLMLCKECYSHLNRGKTPPLSIANDMVIGDVPDELRDLTIVEESMIARCRSKCWVLQLKAENQDISIPNAQRGLKGHVIIYPQRPEQLLSVLPPTVDNVCTPICVVFVGSHKPSQDWLRSQAKPLLVRREKVRAALMWLKTHNPLYHKVQIDLDVLATFPDNDILPVHVETVNTTQELETLTSRYDLGTVDPTQINQYSEESTEENVSNKSVFDSIVVTDVDGDATSNQMRAAAMRHMKSKSGAYLEIPHAEKPVNEFHNPELFPMTYPTLFPYGTGGFESLERRCTVSFKRQIKHYLSLTDRRFQEHYSFLFSVFNILQRRSILLHTSLKVKGSSFDRFAAEFSGVSSQSIHAVCERLATGDHLNIQQMSHEEQRIVKLMKEVNIVTSNVAGSSASRVAMRNEIRSLIIEKGLPSFYITLNFADVYNPLVKFLAGSDIDIDKLLPDEVPKFMDQSILVAKNPFVAAKFFNIYMKAFIRSILRYDSDPSRTDKAGGIFGNVSAYYGCVEAQGRGTLHCHMVIWLDGSLNCDEIRDRVLANDQDFQERLIRFIDDSISNEIPEIPSCEEIPSDTFHPCSIRGLNGNKYPSQDGARQKDLCNLVKSCQSHRHSATCFKYWRGPPEPKECRFDLGLHRYRAHTEFDIETGDLHMRCLDGLVNNFNQTILEAIRCNMDVKFMGSGPSTKAVIYYITDYITKAQLKAHVAYAALELAVKKLESIDTFDDETTIKAKKLLQKCAYSMISQQELSAPQVASYLLDLEDHFTSHKFQKLFWVNFERYIDKFVPLANSSDESIDNNNNNDPTPEAHTTTTESNAGEPTEDAESTEDDEVVVETLPNGDLIPQTSQIVDYIQRGAALRNLSLWEYTTCIEKTAVRCRYHSDNTSDVGEERSEIDSHDSENPEPEKLEILIDDTSRSRPKLPFQSSHPQFATHVQQIRHPCQRPVTTVIGPSIIRRDRPENLVRYHRLMLMFFKPWMTPHDLRGNHQDYAAAFQDFFPVDSRWSKIMNNMQVLHECRDSRDDHFETRSRARQTHVADETARARHVESDDFGNGISEDVSLDILDHLVSLDDCRSRQGEASQAAVMDCIAHAEIGGVFNRDFTTENSSHNTSESTSILITPETDAYEAEWKHAYDTRRQAWKNQLLTDRNSGMQELTHSSNGIESPQINVLLGQSSHPTDFAPVIANGDADVSMSDHSEYDIERVTRQFTLNTEQRRAFEIISSHSLKDKPEQLRMFIGGPGGTGKSRVLDALREYFKSRNESHRFRLASFTGVAAKNIRGMTLHSALSLNKRKRRNDKGLTELISMWRDVDYLFIDEVSMIGCNLMLEIHEALCEAKESTQPFGGINIIFAGDFAQLPPVGDTRLYSHINTNTVGVGKGQRNVFGKLLWLSIDTVVMLHQVVRQNSTSDKKFTDLLERLRHGNCNDDDFDLLNSKILSRSDTDWNSPIWSSAPIIVSNNDTKDALNERSSRNFASKVNGNLNLYYATDKRMGKVIEDDDLQAALHSYHSGKTEQRLGVLPLVEGMPIMICQNYDVEHGIVNGCTGTLRKIRYSVDEKGQRHARSCVIESGTIDGPALPHLQELEMVALEDEVTMTFTHPHSHKRCSIKRTQLPIMPAFAITAHKSQGNTLESAILDIESCHSIEAVYVMLSRVKSSDRIRILRPFQRSKITSRLSEDLRNEFKRLDHLSQSSSPSAPVVNFASGGQHELDRLQNHFRGIVSSASRTQPQRQLPSHDIAMNEIMSPDNGQLAKRSGDPIPHDLIRPNKRRRLNETAN